VQGLTNATTRLASLATSVRGLRAPLVQASTRLAALRDSPLGQLRTLFPVTASAPVWAQALVDAVGELQGLGEGSPTRGLASSALGDNQGLVDRCGLSRGGGWGWRWVGVGGGGGSVRCGSRGAWTLCVGASVWGFV
jgi:hypothetical protein